MDLTIWVRQTFNFFTIVAAYTEHQDPFNLVAQAGAFEVISLPEPELIDDVELCNVTGNFTGNLTDAGVANVTQVGCNETDTIANKNTEDGIELTVLDNEGHIELDHSRTINNTDDVSANITRPPPQPRRTGHVISQMAPEPPVDTCRPEQMPRPIALIGDFAWWVDDQDPMVYIR